MLGATFTPSGDPTVVSLKDGARLTHRPALSAYLPPLHIALFSSLIQYEALSMTAIPLFSFSTHLLPLFHWPLSNTGETSDN